MEALSLVGKIYLTKNYGSVSVLAVDSTRKVYVKFLNTGYEVCTTKQHLLQGNIKDRLAPSVYGVGVVGDYTTKQDGVHVPEYVIWRHMLQRCYDQRTQSLHPAYKGCSVSPNFQNYGYFKSWCNEQVGYGNPNFQIDKDLLVKGNKIYSEATCAFVPCEINSLCRSHAKRGAYPVGVSFDKDFKKFSAKILRLGKSETLGHFYTSEQAFEVYKRSKEAQIKELANKWKSQIDKRVYDALIAWEVVECD